MTVLIKISIKKYFVYNRIDMFNWETIDKIIYINLEKETIRRKHIENELKIIPQDKIIRFDAICEEKGEIGCSKSHIKCLEIAIMNGWKNVLILEDDAKWNNYNENIHILENLMKNDFDVIMLVGCFSSFDKKSFKIINANTLTAYLVREHYFKILLENFKQGLEKLLQTECPSQYAIDQYWKILQKNDNWYLVNPALMIQLPSYSSINKKYEDYTRWFNL
jgi:glycosyl transferase family 25